MMDDSRVNRSRASSFLVIAVARVRKSCREERAVDLRMAWILLMSSGLAALHGQHRDISVTMHVSTASIQNVWADNM